MDKIKLIEELANARELIQCDLMCVLDGQDNEVLTNVCQVVVDRFNNILEKLAPYPWCSGNPTVADCIKRGYCGRDPNCGE